MKTESPFKYLFWAVAGLWIMAILGLIWFMFMRGGLLAVPFFGDGAGGRLFLLAMLVPVLGLIVAIAATVYHDAKKRGLDPWLWATVAAFVPNLIGVIIYLIARHTFQKACIKCGKGLSGDFKICPYCGSSQDQACSQCRQPVMPDWVVCPHCGRPLADKPIG